MPPLSKRKENKPKQTAAQSGGLVGRDREVGIVRNALLRLKGDRSECIVFTGQEGLGKTTLLDHCKAEAEKQGLLVYSAHADESAAGNPYQPLFSALNLSFDSTGEIVRSTMTRATAKEFGMESMIKVVSVVNVINAIIPNLFGVAFSLGDMLIRMNRFNRRQQRAREEHASGRVTNKNFQAIHQILLDLYEEHKKAKPIVLIIDELQYAGETTFKLLDALVTPSFPILLLLGWDNTSSLPKLLRGLVERTHGGVIEIAPLRRDDILTLIDQQAADPHNLAATDAIRQSRESIADFSSGFPGVVQDSVEYLIQGGDPALFSANDEGADDTARGAKLVGALTSKYLDALDPDLYSLLECAAVMGRRFPLEVMTSETMRSYQGLTANRRIVLKQLAELAARKQVVSVDKANSQMLAFNSVYIYNTLLNKLPPPLLRADHLEVARAWEQLAEEQGNLERVAGELARHFFAAEHYVPASRYYMVAAGKLFNETAYAEAVDAFGKVLTCLDQMPASAENNAIRTEVLTTRSLAYEYLGQNKDAIADLEAALPLISADSDEDDERGQPATPAQAHSPDQRRADLLSHLGWLYFKLGNYSKAAACFDSCEQLYKAAGDLGGLVRVGIYRGSMFSQQHRYEAAIKELEGCLEQYSQRGITGAAQVGGDLNAAQMTEAEELDRLYLELGLVYNRMRRLDEAEQYLRLALKIAEAQGDRAAVVQGKHYLGQCLSLQDKEEAIQYLKEAQQEAREQLKDRYLAASIGNTIAYAYQHLGQPEQAVQTFQQLIPELEALSDSYGLGAAYNGLGELYARMWRFDDALTYLNRDLELVNAEEHPSASLLSKLSNQLADLQRLQGDHEQAWANMRISRAKAELSDGAGREHDEGYAALTEARLHADAGEIVAAQQVLAEAQQKLTDIADAQGAIAVMAAQLSRLQKDWNTTYKLLTDSLHALWPNGDLYDIALTGLELTRLCRDMGDLATAHKWADWTVQRAQGLNNQLLAQLVAREADGQQGLSGCSRSSRYVALSDSAFVSRRLR